MLDPILMNEIRRTLDEWETPTLHMYLDSEGNVTVGIGTLLEGISEAKGIPFYHRGSGTAATPEEIERAYGVIAAGSAGQKARKPQNKFSASHYEFTTDLLISSPTAIKLRDAHINTNYADLQRIYPKFNTFPSEVKIALFDMAYNLGARKLDTGFPNLKAAINRRDWRTAARESHRRGVQSGRNLDIGELFSEAAINDALLCSSDGYKAVATAAAEQWRWW
jgi:GH24 family phage-related lysozyme (muramidase)